MNLRTLSYSRKITPFCTLITWIIFLSCPFFTWAQSRSFFAPPQPTGTITVKLYPMENVTPGVSKLVTFGVPFPRGSLTVTDLARVRVLKGNVEIPAFVEQQTPWRHLTNTAIDGQSVRVARIQIHYTFAVSFPNSEQITVEWGVTNRTQNVATFENPRSAWHQVTTGTFVAADNVFEPDVYAVLPKAQLSKGALKGSIMDPFEDSIPEARENPADMDAVATWSRFLEQEHAFKNNFYSMINEDDPRVTNANKCDYKNSVSTSTNGEPWLYDRASTMYSLYFRSGYLKPLREAVRAADFYKGHITANGYFNLKVPDDSKYSYNENLAYTYWLTGDNSVIPTIQQITLAHQSSQTRWSPTVGFWTERNTAFALLASLVAYEVLGDNTNKTRAQQVIADCIWHQNGANGQVATAITNSGGNPANIVDGGLYHTGGQHGDGEENSMVASSWMTSLIVDGMVRAYAFSDDANIANFVKRAGNFERAATKTDDDHIYGSGPLAYPDYMVRYDGTSDPLDGRLGDMVEHALDVGVVAMWADFFNQLQGNPPNQTLRQLGASLYTTYDVSVNHWIRPAGPESGLTAYRVSPWRKWGWEHRISGSYSWLSRTVSGGAKFADFDGDGKSDVTIFRPSNGFWYILQSAAGSRTQPWGLNGDRLAYGDYDGDGKTDVAIFRPSNGLWYVINSSNGSVQVYQFGISEDLPRPGDYDGDGKADVAVWRPSNGVWYLQRSRDGFAAVQFGQNSDIPLLGDFDGDGKSDLVIWRQSTGIWYIFNLANNTFQAIPFGLNGDRPAPADYDGDGKTDIAVFRQSTGIWYLNRSRDGFMAFQFGLNGDVTVAADYDGDGKADVAVWRPSNGVWYLQRSAAGFQAILFGLAGDIPVQSAYS